MLALDLIIIVIKSCAVKTLLVLMQDQHLKKSPVIEIQLCLWSLRITITLTENALLTFLHTGVEKLLAWLSN